MKIIAGLINRSLRIIDLGLRDEPAQIRIETVGGDVSLGSKPSPKKTDQRRDTTAQREEVKSEDISTGRTLLLYVAVIAGAFCNRLLDVLPESDLSFSSVGILLFISAVLSTVGFYSIFRNKLDGVYNPSLQVFLAFENGFFVDAVITQLTAATSAM